MTRAQILARMKVYEEQAGHAKREASAATQAGHSERFIIANTLHLMARCEVTALQAMLLVTDHGTIDVDLEA